MTIKITELINLYEMMKVYANKKLPTKLNYVIARNLKTLDSEVNTYQEQRIKILEDKAKKDENGNAVIKDNQFVFDNEEEKIKAQSEIQELLNTELNINLMKISSSIFENYGDNYDDISVGDLLALNIIMED